MVTAIECVSASCECLDLMVILSASTYRDDVHHPRLVVCWLAANRTRIQPPGKARINQKLRMLICGGFGVVFGKARVMKLKDLEGTRVRQRDPPQCRWTKTHVAKDGNAPKPCSAPVAPMW